MVKTKLISTFNNEEKLKEIVAGDYVHFRLTTNDLRAAFHSHIPPELRKNFTVRRRTKGKGIETQLTPYKNVAKSFVCTVVLAKEEIEWALLSSRSRSYAEREWHLSVGTKNLIAKNNIVPTYEKDSWSFNNLARNFTKVTFIAAMFGSKAIIFAYLKIRGYGTHLVGIHSKESFSETKDMVI